MLAQTTFIGREGEGRNMDIEDKELNHTPHKRDDAAMRNGIADDLTRRITGLEKAKTEPGMTSQDIAALDRTIVKLKEKLSDLSKPKE